MKTQLAMAVAAVFLPLQAFSTEVGIEIPVNKQGFGTRLPLLQEVPVSKSQTLRFQLLEIDGQCHIHMGQLKANLELPAPCDVKTKGAAFGFKPSVQYNDKNDRIDSRTSASFSVVGGLRYFPSRRAECGSQRRDVQLKFNVNKNTPSGLEPQLVLSELIVPEGNLRSHCPRQYDDLK